ncbi:MFS transporter [Limosilactobacillus mucosae]|jgi:sugar (glycoside-pentoside-hexuronide) transporter|uniref:MFS transporter n=1 Tax=Limosilactobacillus mucosae TaxID=97478 RepID=UPI0022E2D476|nr:glycoside-pentoside-hexuronide (GPH):cation symporter [Limosilactobacillus mucosae]
MESKASAPQHEKTSKALAVYYSFGEIGDQLSWYMINTYLMVFYTDVLGLAAGAISIIMLIARIVQGIASPVWGAIQDRTNSKWGKFRPWLMFLAPFMAIFNILTFTVFPVTGVAQIFLCCICYIIVGLLYTAISNAYSALVNVVSSDSQVRMNLSAARSVGSSIIQMILSAVAMPMILFFGHSTKANGTGYFWATVVCSVAMIPFVVICGLKCKETVKESSTPSQASSSSVEKISIWTSLKALVKNSQLDVTVGSTFFGAASTMLRMMMLVYYVIYVVGSYTLVAPIMTTLTIAQLIGSALLPWGTKTFGKKGYMIGLNVIQILSLVGLFFFKDIVVVFILNAIIGFTNSSANITFGMMSDSIEYGDWKYGVRNIGLSVSMITVAVSIATAVTGSIGALLLQATGYVANQAQSVATQTGINAIVNLVPAAVTLISTILLLFYKLDQKTVDQIAIDLKKRSMDNSIH